MRALIALLFTLLPACGGAPAPGTRRHDMSVDEHMKLTGQHSAEASRVAGTGTGTAAGSPYPWYYFWDPASEHEQLARAHALAGTELELEVRTACAGVTDDEVRRSPLADAEGVQQIERWVVFHFRGDTPSPDRLLARLRCWRTSMMLVRRSTADATCLDGVVWTAHAGAAGVDLMAMAPDRGGAAELVRRATQEVR